MYGDDTCNVNSSSPGDAYVCVCVCVMHHCVLTAGNAWILPWNLAWFRPWLNPGPFTQWLQLPCTHFGQPSYQLHHRAIRRIIHVWMTKSMGQRQFWALHLTVIVIRSNISSWSWYCIDHCSDWGRVLITVWTHKRHPIARPNGWAMGCILWRFGRKLTVL